MRFGLSGRTEKASYIGYAALYLLIVFAVAFAETQLDLPVRGELSAIIFIFIVVVATAFLMVPASVRRLHDLGRSGWWLLAFFVPLANFLLLAALGFVDGQRDTNRFGPGQTARGDDAPSANDDAPPTKKAVQPSAPAVRQGSACAQCNRNFGSDWHYDFENVVLGQTYAVQCKQCGIFLCDGEDDAHLGFDASGSRNPCPNCGATKTFVNITPGAAYSSMVEAEAARYRGHIRHPGQSGRPVIRE